MLQARISRAGSDARRADARQKIELGGLVVKAGLREGDRAVVLAILMEGAARLSDPSEHERLRRIGIRELGGKV